MQQLLNIILYKGTLLFQHQSIYIQGGEKMK